MRRWHSERALMIRRWRQELAKHGDSSAAGAFPSFPLLGLAPPSLAPAVDCHCSAGIGSMRKRTPLDCGRARCGLCHFEKFYLPKARAAAKRAAIEYELSSG